MTIFFDLVTDTGRYIVHTIHADEHGETTFRTFVARGCEIVYEIDHYTLRYDELKAFHKEVCERYN